MEHYITEMTLDRYDELITFWHNTEGIWNSDDDDYANLQRLLQRNPGLSLVVLHEDRIIGTVKCSHDGGRGYLHHLAVNKEFRNRGIGHELVLRCLQGLRKEGIKKTRIFVLDTNSANLGFWKNLGFDEKIYDYRTLEFED
ncbi:GNAT family N-acetyltransferase [Chloroflexota bacterium]